MLVDLKQVTAVLFVVNQKSEPGRARDSSHLIWWLFAPVVLLGVYVLSVGPMVKLAHKGFISPSFTENIYAPLVELTNHNKAAKRFVLWYMLDVWHGKIWS